MAALLEVESVSVHFHKSGLGLCADLANSLATRYFADESTVDVALDWCSVRLGGVVDGAVVVVDVE